MYFIVGLPKLGNKLVIMVVIDCLSKYAHLYALQHKFTTSTMVHIFKLHGMPNSIVSYRDTTFTRNFWQELFKIEGTQLHLNTTYHSQTDGETKFVNKCLETYLRYFSFKRKNWWAQGLPLYEWWHNTSYHTTNRMTPFEVVYGQNHPSIISYFPWVSKVQEVETNITICEAILHALK
jgi:hypothetical protein